MAPSAREGPSDQTILREVSTVLRGAAEPDQLTFKQVRLAVEKSLGLPEGSLRKSCKATIKEAVHSVMDELDREAAAEEKEAEEDENGEEAEFDGVRSVNTSPGTINGEPPSAKSAKKRGRVAVVSESAADGEVVPAAKRRNAKDTEAESSGGEEDEDPSLVCVLSETAVGRRQVNVETYHGKVLVQIREHYGNKKKGFAHSKKGIALNTAQWKALRRATKRIDQAVDQLLS